MTVVFRFSMCFTETCRLLRAPLQPPEAQRFLQDHILTEFPRYCPVKAALPIVFFVA